jgi:hypothetical protein
MVPFAPGFTATWTWKLCPAARLGATQRAELVDAVTVQVPESVEAELIAATFSFAPSENKRWGLVADAVPEFVTENE